MLVPEDSLGDIPSLEPPPGAGRLGEAAEGASAGQCICTAGNGHAVGGAPGLIPPQVLEPGWEVPQGDVADDLAVLTWSFQDDDGFSWFGVLLITPG